MPRLIFKNNFEVALAQPTTTSDTTITIRSGSGFPTLGANERVVATIVDAATGLQFEIVTVTAVVGNVLTVQRAQEGTAARAWAAGDMLSIRTTAATLTNAVRNYGTVPSGMDLNALDGTWFGEYQQPSAGAASSSLHYPVSQAGVLLVKQVNDQNPSHCIQIYYPTLEGIVYVRRYRGSWTGWVQMFGQGDVIPVVNGGTGQTTIQGMKSAFGFGTVADQNIVPTSMGGTGSADNAQAWLNIRPKGSTPLAGDPVNDYDAATKRWVENLVNTGTVGPSMNGVMNYGVGDFHLRDSRAYIQPYEVVADGQLLNRADWPELWAYAQMLSPIADADWLADPAKRGKYSLGNGTTTFRVPDRNGVQTGSIDSLYGRGDGGNSSLDGTVIESGAPDIQGSIRTVSAAAVFENSGQSGAFYNQEATYPYADLGSITAPGATTNYPRRVSFSANRSNSVYGRTTTEIRTKSFIGVWVIRASGGFVAANTQWSVINADSSAPENGVNVVGGKVESQYKNPSATQYARLYSGSVWGQACFAAIESQGSKTHAYKFYEDGGVDFRKSGVSNQFDMYTALASWSKLTSASRGDLTAGGMDRVVEGDASDAIALGYSIGAIRFDGFPVKTGFHQYVPALYSPLFGSAVISIGSDNGWCRFHFGIDGQIYGSTMDGEFTYTKNGVSDERVKKSISPATADKAWSNILGLEFCNFVYINDEKERVRHGIIAQQAETIEPLYVKTRLYPSKEIGDDPIEQKELDTTPMLLDTMHVVQELMKKVESLKAEIAALKAAK